MRALLLAFSLSWLTLLPACSERSLDQNIYVSVAGDDENSGSKERPFASLERAREEVKARKKNGGVTVWIRGGSYFRDKSFELTDLDSGKEGATVVYRAMTGENVRIVGGNEVSGFQYLPNVAGYEKLNPAVRENVLAVDLKKQGILEQYYNKAASQLTQPTIRSIGVELFFNNRPMAVAHWPNSGWSTIVEVTGGYKGGRFRYAGDVPGQWSRLEDIILDGYWNYDWAEGFYGVKSIDANAHEIQTTAVTGNYGFLAGQRFRALNVLEELDEPGEWYLDKDSGFLFFWPPENVNSGRVLLSHLDEPLVSMRNTSYITFLDITFESTHGSGVEIVGGNNNLVAGSVLRNIGTVGVAIGGVMDQSGYLYFHPTFSGDVGSGNGVVGCEIYNTGWSAVSVGGGDRLTLRSGLNSVRNNRIHDTGRLSKTDRPSILLYGAGNIVSHNLIYNAPSQAISFWGNNHIIEYNDIGNVVTEITDSGALYTGRDFSQSGTVIRYNLFHDLTGKSGGHIAVYLDDFASGITIYGNIFYKVNFAINIGGGRDNTVQNNLFVDNPISLHMDARGLTWASYYFDGSNNTLFDRLDLVNYQQPPYSVAYPSLVDIRLDQPAIPKGNKILNNVFSGNSGPLLIDGTDTYTLLSGNIISEAVGFVTIDKAGPLLSTDSPAWRLGFEPIPREQIGLQIDQYRAAIP